MQVTLVADGRVASGGASLVVHNERLADPLDSIVKKLSTLTKKRNKTEEDHMDIGYYEFMGGLYTAPRIEWDAQNAEFCTTDGEALEEAVPGLPSWNILRCLQDGAKRVKRGQDILRGVSPLTEFCFLDYDGPTDPEALWQDGGFTLRKSVGVQRARTIRTRPIFQDWVMRLETELDLNIMDVHTLQAIWVGAGRYSGLGEMRPIYGKFSGQIELPENADQIAREEQAAAAAVAPPAPPRRTARKKKTDE